MAAQRAAVAVIETKKREAVTSLFFEVPSRFELL